MKNQFNLKLLNKISVLFCFMFISLSSCDFEYDIVEAGSQPDLTPPSADFNYSQGQGTNDEWKTYSFGNLSISATDYVWDFGNGNTVTTLDATYTFAGEGSYVITLTASDKLGVTSTVSKTIEVVMPIIPTVLPPTIQGAGFEVDSDKTFWQAPFSRVGSSTSVMQTTTSNGYYEGARGGKFPNSEERLGYQELVFTPNTSYVLSYKYRMKNTSASPGVMNVSIVTPLTSWNLATLPGNTIATNAHFETTSNVSELTTGILSFNSGANTNLAILLYNEVEEMYIDSFTIIVQ